jgi:hypothetical protein
MASSYSNNSHNINNDNHDYRGHQVESFPLQETQISSTFKSSESMLEDKVDTTSIMGKARLSDDEEGSTAPLMARQRGRVGSMSIEEEAMEVSCSGV